MGEGATLEQEEELHQEPPNKVDILEELQGVLQVAATQEVLHLEEVTHLKASRVLILEQQHLHLLTLRWSNGSEQSTRITPARLMPRSSARLLPMEMAVCSVRRRAGR